MGKWDWMRKQFPALAEDAEYQDVVNAAKEPHREKSLEQLAEAANDLEGQKAAAEQVLSGINAELTGVEQLLLARFEDSATEKLTVGGYTFKPQTTPAPKVADPVAFRAWVDHNSPHILSVNHQTLKGIVSRALEGDGQIPDGIEVKQHTSISRRK